MIQTKPRKGRTGLAAECTGHLDRNCCYYIKKIILFFVVKKLYLAMLSSKDGEVGVYYGAVVSHAVNVLN
jgi:hypothetical protein